ncbi:hypothetical protein ColKHC_08075 [Colletotrichum higginsianum]|nr:hypothetical protein ColKHC_08075 [Colletotrichum higginsianum]
MMNDRPPPPADPDPVVPRELKAKRAVPSPRKAPTVRSGKGSIFGKASIPSVYWAGDDDSTPVNNDEFTFYREGTPPPLPEGGSRESEKDALARARGYRQSVFDHDEEDSERGRRRRCCGMRAWVAWLLVALVVAVALGVGIGVGVGVGARADNTVYHVVGSDKRFLRLCGLDYTGDDGAIDMSDALASTMGECMEQCARVAQCTGVSWGNVLINGAPELRCWLKRDLKKSRATVANWNFAVLL